MKTCKRVDFILKSLKTTGLNGHIIWHRQSSKFQKMQTWTNILLRIFHINKNGGWKFLRASGPVCGLLVKVFFSVSKTSVHMYSLNMDPTLHFFAVKLCANFLRTLSKVFLQRNYVEIFLYTICKVNCNINFALLSRPSRMIEWFFKKWH